MSRVTLEEAVAEIEGIAPIPVTETVSLDASLGRVLAENLRARMDVPEYDVSAMDGWACRARDTADATATAPAVLRYLGDVPAGDRPRMTVGAGEAASISTGAAVPDGADAIALREHVTTEDGRVLLFRPATPRHIRRRGESLRHGEVYLSEGRKLGPMHVALAAALGWGEVRVARAPHVALLVTGPEVRAPGGAVQAGRVYDVNGPLLRSLLTDLGVEVTFASRAGDSFEDVGRELDAACAAGVALIVTTGGASIGRHDVMRTALQRASGTQRFGGIRVAPGGPTLLGTWRGTPVLALPGNPFAAALIATTLLASWAHAAMGRTGRSPFHDRRLAWASSSFPAKPDKARLWLGRRHRDDAGRLMVERVTPQDSGRILPLVQGNALVWMAEGSGAEPGDEIQVVSVPPWTPPFV